MRRVFVVMWMLLAAGIAIGAWASKGPQHKPARAKAPSLKSLREQHRAQRSQGPGVQQQQPVLHGRARAQARHPQTPAAVTGAVRSIQRSILQTSDNPAPINIGLTGAASLWPEAAYPEDAAVGDFNGDGTPDLVFTSEDDTYNWKLFTMMGTGGGAFATPVALTFPVPCVSAIFTADVNADKKDDFVITDCYDNLVHVYLNDGAGNFTTQSDYPQFPSGFPANCYDWDPGCEAHAVTDVNTDGFPDLVFVRHNQYSVLTNDGAGVFTAAQATLPGYSSTWALALGDLNGDGFLDIVGEIYQSGYALQIIMGTATGPDSTATVMPKPQIAYDSNQYAIADVNGDGKPDVVSLDYDILSVGVFYQGDAGKFTYKGPYFAGDYSYAMSVGDFNGDGKAEVAVVGEYDGTVTILGGEPLAIQSAYGVGGSCYECLYTPPVVADLNGDGKLDLTVPNWTWDLAFLRNLGDGTFAGARFYWLQPISTPNDYYEGYYSYQYPWTVTIGDINKDGFNDVVVGQEDDEYYRAGVAVFLNNGDGTLKPGYNVGSGGYLYNAALADINGDGNLDIIAADQEYYTVDVFLGDGKGHFQDAVYYPSGVSGDDPFGLAIGDFNADSMPDVAVHNYDVVSVLLNDRQGGLLPAVDYPLDDSRWDGRLVAADINGDGNLDLISEGYYQIEILTGVGDGTFNAAAAVDWTAADNFYFSDSDFSIADVNKDGKLDIIAATTEGCEPCTVARARGTANTGGYEGVVVSLGNGDGTFNTPVMHKVTLHDETEFSSDPYSQAVADINGDGNPDILVANYNYGTLALLYGDGTGNFYDPVEYLSAGYEDGIAVADLNGDQAPDVVAAAYSDEYIGGVAVHLNTGGSIITLTSSKNPAAEGDTVDVGVTVKPFLAGMTGVPSGTVSLYDGTTKVGEGTLASGAATVSVASLTAGVHELTASYLGDTNFLPTSAILVQLAHGPDDYDLSVDKTSATVKAGQSVVFVLTITPKNGFVGTVTFDCGTLPAGVTCGFNPTSVTPNGKDPVTVMLSIHTTATTTSAALAPQHGNSQLPVLATLWGAGVMGLVVVGGSRKRKAAFLISLLALAILLAVLVGCGGTRTVTNTVVKQVPVQTVTPAGQHAMTIMATSTGGTGKPLDLTLNVE